MARDGYETDAGNTSFVGSWCWLGGPDKSTNRSDSDGRTYLLLASLGTQRRVKHLGVEWTLASLLIPVSAFTSL
jgi:hypothetical protein